MSVVNCEDISNSYAPPQVDAPVSVKTIGVSFAEWRFETRKGNEAFSKADFETASEHYLRADGVANGLIWLADQGRVDPYCAVNAAIEACRNVAENKMRLGDFQDAAAILEKGFMKFCLRAAWPRTSLSLRDACKTRIGELLETYVALLERIQAPTDKVLSAYAIADRALAQTANLETVA